MEKHHKHILTSFLLALCLSSSAQQINENTKLFSLYSHIWEFKSQDLNEQLLLGKDCGFDAVQLWVPDLESDSQIVWIEKHLELCQSIDLDIAIVISSKNKSSHSSMHWKTLFKFIEPYRSRIIAQSFEFRQGLRRKSIKF